MPALGMVLPPLELELGWGGWRNRAGVRKQEMLPGSGQAVNMSKIP